MNKLYSSVVNNESFNLYFPDEGINTSFKEFKIDVFKAKPRIYR